MIVSYYTGAKFIYINHLGGTFTRVATTGVTRVISGTHHAEILASNGETAEVPTFHLVPAFRYTPIDTEALYTEAQGLGAY